VRYAALHSIPAAEPPRTERPTGPVDYRLLFIVVTLALIGLVLVYASTYHLGLAYLKWQFIRAGVGLVALFFGIKLDHTRLAGRASRTVVIILALLALAATLACGELVGVTRRNILGVVQPSEFVKFALVIWLSAYFADLRDSGRKWNLRNSLLKPAAVVALVVGLTLMQPAVGTSVIMALSSLAVFFVVGVKKRYLLLGLAVVAALVVGAAQLVQRLDGTKFYYAWKRWTSFGGGENYHQTQSLIAIGSGGVFGRGLGEGKQKYYFLPKLHKDFIFATLGEEFGFVGSVAVLLLYLLLLYRGMRIGRRTTTSYGQYLASGITVTIFLYSVVHEAVTLAVMPTTGQPLPFISYGGSALVANMFAAGMVLRISRFRRHGLDEAADGGGWNRRPRVSGARPGI